MQLVLGAKSLDRVVLDVEQLLLAYRADDGYSYLEFSPSSPVDQIVPEDLAVTLLVNSRVTGQCFKSILERGASVDLRQLTSKPLETTTAEERTATAAVIATVASWPGFASSTATKVLHKKRPALIPILDNQAIFGAYMNPSWPGRKSLQDSVKDQRRIEDALQWIATDLARPENVAVWAELQMIEPKRSLIQLFDSIWWMYFRKMEPLRG
ncbi:MAG: hypothetical protein K2Y37_12840 [Pirellulales bacterium]|nr:hypothetical protein [Pirellulales bacterium]